MRHDPKLAASYDNISNLDELTLAVATKLGRKLYKELTPYVPDRLYYVASFVEDLYAAIGSMKDRYVLRLTWDRRFDWHRLSMVPATSAAAAPSGPAVGSPSASASTTAPVPLREPIAEGLDNAAPKGSAGAGANIEGWKKGQQQRDEDHLKLIGKLLTDLKPFVRPEEFAKLQSWVEMCKETKIVTIGSKPEIALGSWTREGGRSA
jgi:hypothetical protein